MQINILHLACLTVGLGLTATCPTLRAQPFEIVSTDIPNLKLGSVVGGDLDEDGDLDLVLAGYDDTRQAQRTVVMRNDSGTFVDSGAQLPGFKLPLVSLGDYDRDGDLDLLISGNFNVVIGDQVHLYRNDGGTFSRVDLPFEKGLGAVFGDYDMDGDLDILASVDRFGNASVALNGGESFERVDIQTEGGTMRTVGYVEDIDGDGDADIFGSKNNVQIKAIYLNQEGILTATSEATHSGWDRSVGDFDSDGFFDVPAFSLSLLQILRVNDYEFQSIQMADGVPGGFWEGSAIGDLDNDGLLDAASYLEGSPDATSPTGISTRFSVMHLVTSNESVARIGFEVLGDEFPFLRDQQQGSWPPDSPLGASMGDYDNDGDLDLIAIGPDAASNSITVLAENMQTTPGSAPETPSGLTAIRVGEGRYRLEWSPSSDDTTPTDALTYAVRIGTTPGGSEVMTAQALSSGYRQLMGRGNAGSHEHLIINGLKPGTTYYWSVQAIDNGYAGSRFAEESSFAVMPVANEGIENQEPGIRPVWLEIWPNPATSRVSASFALAAPAETEISVRDVLGRTVLADVRFLPAGQQTIPISVAGLPNGLYFLTLQSGIQTTSTSVTILAR